MSEPRFAAVQCELNSWLEKKYGTKRELLSLIGKLVFLCRVIRPGRIFMRRLIDLSTKVKKLFHRIKLSAEARHDIEWWTKCADNWNGRSIFYDSEWVTSEELQMFTDASNAVFGRHWFGSPLTAKDKLRSIAWRELLLWSWPARRGVCC